MRPPLRGIGSVMDRSELASECADAVAQMTAEGIPLETAIRLQGHILELTMGLLAGRSVMAEVRAHFVWGVAVGEILFGKK